MHGKHPETKQKCIASYYWNHMNIILSIHLIKTEMCSGVGMSGYVFFSEINGSAS